MRGSVWNRRHERDRCATSTPNRTEAGLERLANFRDGAWRADNQFGAARLCLFYDGEKPVPAAAAAEAEGAATATATAAAAKAATTTLVTEVAAAAGGRLVSAQAVRSAAAHARPPRTSKQSGAWARTKLQEARRAGAPLLSAPLFWFFQARRAGLTVTGAAGRPGRT